MRILLLHPNDSPRRGPWSRQCWDLVVDLGKSSSFSEAAWTGLLHCPMLRSSSFELGLDDMQKVRDLFAAARGRLLDTEGFDWWELACLDIVPLAQELLVLKRLAREINPAAELWATRGGWPASVMAFLLDLPLRYLSDNPFSHAIAQVRHYSGVANRFSVAEIRQILLDKYDSGYRWRSRFSRRPEPVPETVVLLPSAYGNVSSMAADYARLLPDEKFLLVATRRNALQFNPPPNVTVRKLLNYAGTRPSQQEITDLLTKWRRLESDIKQVQEFGLLFRTGAFQPFPGWIADGLCAREAWREVLEREPVGGVLCGDDSNFYTRLPVLLAAKRSLPTVDFHHGAFDGRYLVKTLPCDVYLAKNEMEIDYLIRICRLPPEKVALASSHRRPPADPIAHTDGEKTAIVFFSEPYELPGMRAEEVYREVLPLLCKLARNNGRKVILKLHPFEGRAQRQGMIKGLLSAEGSETIEVVHGPLSPELLRAAWFGVTVESSTVLDCTLSGIPCFLCGWLELWPFAYIQQYARFGVGEILRDANEIGEIPDRLPAIRERMVRGQNFWKTAEPATLRELLLSRPQVSAARRVS